MAKRLIAASAAALALASPAAAQTPILDGAAAAYRTSAVYVHQDTSLLTKAEERRLERQIDEEGRGPIYIAILPAAARSEANGTATGVVLELSRRVVTTNPPAVHAAVVGNQFRAVNRDVPAGNLATRAFLTYNTEGVAAVLSDFVHRVGDYRRPRAAAAPEEEGGSFPWWLLLVGGAIAAFFVVRAIRRGRQRERELSDVKSVAREDLVALADDVVGLDEHVEGNPRAKEAYLLAMESYQRADDSFDRARSPQDISKVTAALAESRYQMETAKAHLAGEAPPAPGPPCFFDPRHGTSKQEVTWNSPYAGLIRVPVCDEDARRIQAGLEPEARRVPVGGQRRPIWDAPAYYQPWALGFFGLAGGMFLGSAIDPGTAEAGTFEGDGGDWGGGDFGGGDGGGGGDFGGGGDGGGF
jgi:uncharacterized membrane protein YgcG